MTNLEENINHYMELKGIKFYTDLLVDIAHELNIKGKEAYDFANREKANFSKMLKGQRPLKYEFIIPLEKIFGMPLARLLDKDAYKLPIEKENIPFDKGFRYYAYKDDHDLYTKELANLLTKTGESCLTQTDEFGKTFLDYVVEYNAVNGIRFLHDKYKLKIRFNNNQFDTEPKGMFWVHDKGIELARMISHMGDAQLFNDIYDSRYMMAANGFYFSQDIFSQDEFAEIILENSKLLESVFETKPYRYLYSRRNQMKLRKEFMDFCSINPVINTCLDYALRNLEKYKTQAKKILKFGINHNHRIDSGIDVDKRHLYVDECGGLRNLENNHEIIQVVLIVKQEKVDDVEIADLIKELPIYNKLW